MNEAVRVACRRIFNHQPNETMKRKMLHSVLKMSASVLCALSLQASAQPSPIWQSITIPGLPAGSSLGAVWARTRNEAYVWANRNSGGSSDASLYRWNGSQWYKTLDAPGTYGQSVFGVGSAEVFAGTATNIWRSTDAGQTWTLQTLPALNGTLRNLSGTAGNVQVPTIGGQILRFDGTSWSNVFSDGSNPPYTLSVGSPTEGYYVSCWGWGRWNVSSWAFNGVQFDFCDIYDTWWIRDGLSNLQWYAVGNNNFGNGIRVWKFNATIGSFGCKSCYVFADGTNYNIGNAYAVWGSAAD